MLTKKNYFYIWLVPCIWSLIAIGSYFNSGDEHGLFALSAIPGMWAGFIFVKFGMLPMLLATLVAGSIVMAAVGFLLDKLAVHFKIFILFWLLAAALICILYLTSFESYQHAMSKNGSLLAYIFFSLNTGLLTSIPLMAITTFAIKIIVNFRFRLQNIKN